MSKALAQTAAQIANATKRKPAPAKPVVKAQKPAPVETTNESPITHALVTGRPKAGARLFAFTAAWMELTGFINGKPVDKKLIESVAGTTAVAHHKNNGRFAMVAGKLVLTEGGKIHFADTARTELIDPDVQAAFASVMTTGKPDGVEVKAAACIQPL